MSSITFNAVIKILGVNPYVLVSKARIEAIKPGWRRPLPVLVRINGMPQKPWRINMMPKGDGSFYLYLHGDVRKASKTKVGDKVTVELEFDAAYRNGPMHPMPDWFEIALSENPIAKNNWEAFPPSRKKEVLRYFANLKSAEATARNSAKLLHVLNGNPARFMGRSWKDGK